MDFMDNDTKKKYAQVIARAWIDPSFKDRLLQTPADVFKEYDITLPAGTEAKVLEDTDAIKHFVLPTKPQGDNDGNNANSARIDDNDTNRIAVCPAE